MVATINSVFKKDKELEKGNKGIIYVSSGGYLNYGIFVFVVPYARIRHVVLADNI